MQRDAKMYERYLNIVEAQLGSLIDAIGEAKGPEDISKKVFEAS